ncbi:MAG: hypothetical protein ACYC9Y_06855 [Candidatus Methylomirabilia bacterium]
MKRARALPRLLLQGIIVALCLFAFHPVAQAADAVDQIADVLDELGPANPFAPYDVTGPNLRTAKAFFNCLDDGTDPIECIDAAQNTPLGQKLSNKADIPSWFWDLVDLYIAWKSSDYWGVVENLGEAALCIVAQYFTSVDLCGVLEDLVNAAKDAYAQAKAWVDFVASIGGAVWEGLKDAGCELGLGGCDDGPPPPPPEDVAYGAYFAPVVVSGEGLAAIEAVSSEQFPNKVNTLVGKAWSGPCNLQCANKAADKFKAKVDEQWSGDIAGQVVKDLSKSRNDYNTPAQVNASAQKQCAAQYPSPPGNSIPLWCREQLATTLKFAHVDRWIAKHPEKLAQLPLKTNAQWCQETFWNGNKTKFAAAFKGYLTQNGICQSSGNALLCTSLTGYKRCTDLLTDVGEGGLCTLSAKPIMDAANEVYDKLVTAGSTHIGKPVMSTSGVQAVLTASRPVTGKVCASYAASYDNLAKNIVACAVKEDPAYVGIKQQVAQAVAVLNPQYANVLSITPDPLGVELKLKEAQLPVAKFTSLVAALNKAGIPFNLNGPMMSNAERDQIAAALTSAGVPFVTSNAPLPFDGRETPDSRPAANLDALKPPQVGMKPEDKLKKIFDNGGKPSPDPVNQLSLEALKNQSKLLGSEKLDTQALEAKSIADTTLVGAEIANAGGQQLRDVHGAGPAVNVVAPTALKMNVAPGGAPTSGGTPQSTPMSLQFSDLTATDTVTVFGKAQRQTTKWGTPLTLDEKDAVSMANGLCTLTVRYALRNLAGGPVGAFKVVWTSSATAQTVERTWTGLAPEATSAEASEAIGLKPGQNLLTLDIDKAGQTKDGNTKNNQFKLPLLLNGTCGAQTRRLPAPAAVPIRQRPPADSNRNRAPTLR